MNKTRFNKVLNSYINKFGYISQEQSSKEDYEKKQNDTEESYKWHTVTTFQQNWNILDNDFIKMFKASMKDASGLIETTHSCPITGIVKVIREHHDEIDTIRDCFRELFVEEDKNIPAKQQRINSFVKRVNERIQHYFPNMEIYLQTFRSALMFLNFYDPANNYMYKDAPATAFANCMEFGEDFGSGAGFNLESYYKLCDQVLDGIEGNEDLLELQRPRSEEHSQDYDDELHILVYDIIDCALTYDLYDELMVYTKSAGNLYQEDAISKQREATLEQAKSELAAMKQALLPLPDITGMKIGHKKFGEGLVKECTPNGAADPGADNGYQLTIEFADQTKQLAYPMVVYRGIITLQDAQIGQKILQHKEQQEAILKKEHEITLM